MWRSFVSDDILRPEDGSVHRGYRSVYVNPRQTFRVFMVTAEERKFYYRWQQDYIILMSTSSLCVIHWHSHDSPRQRYKRKHIMQP